MKHGEKHRTNERQSTELGEAGVPNRSLDIDTTHYRHSISHTNTHPHPPARPPIVVGAPTTTSFPPTVFAHPSSLRGVGVSISPKRNLF